MENEEFQHSSKNSSDEYNAEKNSNDRKSLDNLKPLLDSQETIFQKVFENFFQSSPSINVGDFEEVSLPDAENPKTKLKPQHSSCYNLRSRKVKTPKSINSQAPSVQNSKHRKPKIKRIANETDKEICSQESVSMLQGCYKNCFDTCVNSNVELSTVSSDEEIENVWVPSGSPRECETRLRQEKYTQTEFPMLLNTQREREITKHANFIGCIVRLKAILSSKDKTAGTNLYDVLRSIVSISSEEGINTAEGDKRDGTLSKETIGYILRSTDTENVFRKTVQTLILHLENIINEDFLEPAGCWRNSVYEMTVGMLNEAVDCDPGIRKMVELFLCRLLESISNDEGTSKNLLLESKAMLLMSFCKSTYLSFASVYYIIGQLERLNMKSQGHISFAEKVSWTNFVKNSYFLLRILEFSLESIKSKLRIIEIDKVLNKEREMKNFNVLEMWKKHWRTNETSSETRTGCQWKLMMSKWSGKLDELLINCVNHFPISAMAVERCKRLVTEILKICHSEERETKT